MENNNIEKAINETVNDLKSKIHSIKSLPDYNSSKIISIKNKTIEVLNSVLVKLDIADNKEMDVKEIEKGLDTISNKSRQLYEDALSRIKQLSLKNEYENNNYDIKQDELSIKVVEILNCWLTPESE